MQFKSTLCKSCLWFTTREIDDTKDIPVENQRYFIVTSYKEKCSLCKHTVHLVMDVTTVGKAASRIFEKFVRDGAITSDSKFHHTLDENIDDGRLKEVLISLYQEYRKKERKRNENIYHSN